MLEVKITASDIKILPDEFNRRPRWAEQRISKLKDRTIEVISLRNKQKNSKECEQGLRDLRYVTSRPMIALQKSQNKRVSKRHRDYLK